MVIIALSSTVARLIVFPHDGRWTARVVGPNVPMTWGNARSPVRLLINGLKFRAKTGVLPLRSRGTVGYGVIGAEASAT
jgi:hypothetical protein